MENYARFGQGIKPWRTNYKLREQEGLYSIGMANALASPFMVEIAACTGRDHVWIDFEHNVFDLRTACNIIRMADAAGMYVLARLAQKEWIPVLLDFGIRGFTFPHVQNAKQAKELVDLTKYAPVGRRNISRNKRAQGYGLIGLDRVIEEAADDVDISIMIEDSEGIKNYKEIFAVPGIDHITIGPGDFAQGMGHLNDPQHPDCVKKREEIMAYAESLGYKKEKFGTAGEDKSFIRDGLKGKAEGINLSR